MNSEGRRVRQFRELGGALSERDFAGAVNPQVVGSAGRQCNPFAGDAQEDGAEAVGVQARAFEVETSKIVSEAAFSGTGDLASLLRIAEDLAKTLADGLKLSYTPDQLAYAEPARLDHAYLDVVAHPP